MEYEKSEFKSVAFTLKRLKDPKLTSQDDYRNDVLDKWNNMSGVILQSYIFEYDDNKILHVHGILAVRKTLNTKRLRFQNYHTYLKDIYDITSWEYYINKINKLCKINNTNYMF